MDFLKGKEEESASGSGLKARESIGGIREGSVELVQFAIS